MKVEKAAPRRGRGRDVAKSDKDKTYLDHLRDLDEHIAKQGRELTPEEKKEILKTIVEVSN